MGWLAAVVAGALTGVLSGFGVGGGTLLLIYLTTFAGMEQSQAQGINLLYFLLRRRGPARPHQPRLCGKIRPAPRHPHRPGLRRPGRLGRHRAGHRPAAPLLWRLSAGGRAAGAVPQGIVAYPLAHLKVR